MQSLRNFLLQRLKHHDGWCLQNERISGCEYTLASCVTSAIRIELMAKTRGLVLEWPKLLHNQLIAIGNMKIMINKICHFQT